MITLMMQILYRPHSWHSFNYIAPVVKIEDLFKLIDFSRKTYGIWCYQKSPLVYFYTRFLSPCSTDSIITGSKKTCPIYISVECYVKES